MRIKTKRIYDSAEHSDGARILIDRIWPRGVAKAQAKIDFWAKDCAPSTELRKWYGHEPDKWPEFRVRYFSELDDNPAAIESIRPYLLDTVTLVFASKETELNNAAAFSEYLEKRINK